MAEDDIVEARALQQGRQHFIRRGRTEFRGYALDAGIHAFELNSRLIADAAQNVAQPGIGALDREQSVLKADFRGRGRLLFRRQRRRWRRQQGAYKSATLRGHDTIRRRSDRPSGDPCGDGRRCNGRNPWVGRSDRLVLVLLSTDLLSVLRRRDRGGRPAYRRALLLRRILRRRHIARRRGRLSRIARRRI